MVNWWWWRESFSSWVLILVLLVPRETQTAYHKNEFKFTAVATKHFLFDIFGVVEMDDIQWFLYHKLDKEISVKVNWISDALGTYLIEDIYHVIRSHEGDAQATIHFLIGNNTQHERNHTMQFLLGCEVDDNIKINSKVEFALDGEAMIGMNEHQNHWVVKNPRARKFKPRVESLFWSNLRKKYIKKYCVDIIQKALWNSSMKENLLPEVFVSRHDSPNGTITFSCLATGFYPRFILLAWKKDNEQGIWGKESSSGTLPNADDTFYLQITLELPPGDSGEGYTCEMKHSEQEKPAVYPVPGKPNKKKTWVITMSILGVFLLILSCVGVFITWKKRKTAIPAYILSGSDI